MVKVFKEITSQIFMQLLNEIYSVNQMGIELPDKIYLAQAYKKACIQG